MERNKNRNSHAYLQKKMKEKKAFLIYESRGKWVVIDSIGSVVPILDGICFVGGKICFQGYAI